MFGRIRLGLTLGYVGVLALILVAFGAVLVAGFRDATLGRHDGEITGRAQTLADALSRGETVDGAMRAMGGADAAQEPADYAVVHLAPDGRVLSRDASARDLGLPSRGSSEAARATTRADEAGVETVDGPGGPARVASVPVRRSGEVVGVVQVAQPLGADLDAVVRLVWVLVPIGLASLILAGLGGLFVSGRAMRPVRDAFERQRAFVADASHELKTPLSLAKLDGEVVLRNPSIPDAPRERIEHQLSEIDRMGAILSDLLVLARLDAGVLGVEREPFDLAPALFETAERFRARAVGRSVTLEVSVPGKLPVRGDEGRTCQVLAALLDNALRFSPKGGRIFVTGNLSDGRAEAAVADSGPGIAPDHLDRVFDRFHRADAARARGEAGGGTGLGLAIARDLARAQGGDLAAENARDGGARLRLTLPAANRI